MIRLLNPPPQVQAQPATATPCACQQHRKTLAGIDLSTLTDNWAIVALVIAAALILYLAMQSTPQRQEAAVKRRAAKAKYRGELERIREEYR